MTRQGEGVGTFSNGEWYEGTWDGDEPHGKGAHHYASGDVYTGEWRRGARHGRGTLACANLDEYEGDWVDGMRWGEGTQKVGESGDVLVGRWERDQLNGRGRLLGGNGEAYDGEFRGGVRDGEGECVYAGGAVYRGQWADGACEGHGRLQNGDAYYEGGWHLGEMCGHATRKYESGEVYNGEFARGLRHGAGAWRDADGNTYDGEWVDGMRHGAGKWTAADGVQLREGSWLQDKLHGAGIEVGADGEKYEGRFERGRRGGAEVVELANLVGLLERWEAVISGECSARKRGVTDDAARASLADLRPKWLRLEEKAPIHGYGTLIAADGATHNGFFRDGAGGGPRPLLRPRRRRCPRRAGRLRRRPRRRRRLDLRVGRGDQLWRQEEGSLGQYAGGRINGLGAVLYASGAVHVGTLVDSMAAGPGTRWYADGRVYEGQWEAPGSHHGHGELRTPAATGAAEALYVGGWLHGPPPRRGVGARARTASYEGGWEMDAPHGRGTLRSAPADGRTYTGAFEGARRRGGARW